MQGKRILAWILAACTLLAIAGCGGTQQTSTEPVQEDAEQSALPFEVNSPSVILMDAGTGTVLGEKAADERIQPAGAAKAMTLLLIAEAIDDGHLKLEEEIQISDNAAKATGTRAFLDQGAKYSVETLLKSICVASANDSSIALAEKISGSTDVFVAKMNERAKELGATNTNFVNLTGIAEEGAYTTARDLALIAKELVTHKQILKYTSIYLDEIQHPEDRVTELANPNRLVRFYGGADGLCTGSSTESKYNGVFTAKKGELRLIVVVLGAQNSNTRFEDAKVMLDYGFATYNQIVAVKKGELVRKNVPVNSGMPKTVNLIAKEELRIIVQKGEEKQLKKELDIPETLQSPIQAGEKVGTLNVSIGDRQIAQVEVTCEEEIQTVELMDYIRLMFRRWVTG